AAPCLRLAGIGTTVCLLECPMHERKDDTVPPDSAAAVRRHLAETIAWCSGRATAADPRLSVRSPELGGPTRSGGSIAVCQTVAGLTAAAHPAGGYRMGQGFRDAGDFPAGGRMMEPSKSRNPNRLDYARPAAPAG